MNRQAQDMRLLILDTADDAGAALVAALSKNGTRCVSQRIDSKLQLLDALRGADYDILILDGASAEISADECVGFFRREAIDCALVVLQQQPFDRKQLTDALQSGIAGLACMQQPAYSLAMLSRVYKNLADRRTRKLERNVKALIERSPIAPGPASDAIAYIHDGMHVFANDSYIKLFKYSDLDEVLATPFMDMVASQCREELKVSLRACQKSGKVNEPAREPAILELEAIDASQATFPLTLGLKPTFYEGEHCLQVLIKGQQVPDSDDAELRAGVQELFDASLEQTGAGQADAVPAENNRAIAYSGDNTPAHQVDAASILSEQSVTAALDTNSIVLVYQPVMSTSGLEPALYDIHPLLPGQRNDIAASEALVAIVSNSPVGQQLDRWTFERSIRLLGELFEQGIKPGFQLTLSAQSIRDEGFSAWLGKLLETCQVSADALVVSLREADVLANRARTLSLMASLHDIGCRVCISGFTNRQSIHAIAPGYKVGFVRFDNGISDANTNNMLSLDDLKTLVESLHKDNVKVIAADVADRETVDCLWIADVDLFQGAWFQREAQELHARSFSPQIPVLREAVR